MVSTQQSRYGQIPGAYLAEEEEESYLQSMNDLAGK